MSSVFYSTESTMLSFSTSVSQNWSTLWNPTAGLRCVSALYCHLMELVWWNLSSTPGWPGCTAPRVQTLRTGVRQNKHTGKVTPDCNSRVTFDMFITNYMIFNNFHVFLVSYMIKKNLLIFNALILFNSKHLLPGCIKNSITYLLLQY